MNSTWICIASGPSLTDEDCITAKRSSLPIITTNSTYQRITPDIICADDEQWWCEHRDLVPEGPELWTCQRTAASQFGLHQYPYYDPHNSGNTAIRIAAQMGARSVILLSYDCGATDGLTHWHGDHPPSIRSPDLPYDYERWRVAFEDTARLLSSQGVDVINCSRRTTLTCFKRMSLDEALYRCRVRPIG